MTYYVVSNAHYKFIHEQLLRHQEYENQNQNEINIVSKI